MQIFNLQYLRGIAAVAVVFLHIYTNENKILGEMAVTPSWFSIGDSGVDLFFVISGFIMIFINPKPINSLLLYARFLAQRFTRIYPPYWIVSLLLIPLWLVQPKMFNHSSGNHVDIWRSFLLLPQNFLPLLAVGWTLIHEIYFYFIVSFAIIFNKTGRWIFGITWFFGVFIIFTYFHKINFDNNRILQVIFSPFSLTFLLGYFIALAYNDICKLSRSWLVVILALGILGLVLGYCFIRPEATYPNNNLLSRFVAYGLPCSLIVLSALGLEVTEKKHLDLLLLLGDASYSIYLTHLPLVRGFYTIIKLFGVKSMILSSLSGVLCMICCLTTGIAFHIFIERRIIVMSRSIIDSIIPSVKL